MTPPPNIVKDPVLKSTFGAKEREFVTVIYRNTDDLLVIGDWTVVSALIGE